LLFEDSNELLKYPAGRVATRGAGLSAVLLNAGLPAFVYIRER